MPMLMRGGHLSFCDWGLISYNQSDELNEHETFTLHVACFNQCLMRRRTFCARGKHDAICNRFVRRGECGS